MLAKIPTMLGLSPPIKNGEDHKAATDANAVNESEAYLNFAFRFPVHPLVA